MLKRVILKMMVWGEEVMGPLEKYQRDRNLVWG